MARPSISPVGVGDLKVLKQKIVRYEAGEIAHIENVLGREARLRDHRMFRQFIERLEEELEQVDEQTRSLQTTERFEIESEIERMVRSDSSFQAGASLSGGFGPVSLSAYVRSASSSAREKSERNATRFAKEMVDKATSRLVDRVQTTRSSVTTQETEEKNRHEFDNRSSSDHVVGVYRWVDKLYRVRQVTYGRRLFYEFVIPEPAALFRALKRQAAIQDGVSRPARPVDPETRQDLRPDHLTAETYMALVSEYQVRDVKPPPPETVIITKAFAEVFGDGYFEVVIDDFDLPTGYVARSFSLRLDGFSTDWGSEDASLNVSGTQTPIRSFPSFGVLDGESDKIPIVAVGKGWSLLSLGFTVELECQLTSEARAEWQLETYSRIMAAYQQQEMAYQDRARATAVQVAGAVRGQNPEINRRTERDHLQWLCLSLWAGLRGFADAYEPTFPDLRAAFARLNAVLIEFFHGAFDWENMSYEFLPFSYGARRRWGELMTAEDPDPAFQAFLQAGAARVRVPVEPAFTEAVLWYQLTGQIREAEDVPRLETSGVPEAELFNAYLAEMDSAEDLPDIDADAEISADDPDSWLIRLPTSLVWLEQTDNPLPSFETG